MMSYLFRHLQVFMATLGDLFRSPLSSIMSALVIGITMAIPAIGFTLLNSAESMSRNWDISPQINVYLEDSVNENATAAIINEFEFIEGIAGTRLISKQQALQDFKRISGLGDELNALEENPLPTTIVVEPQIDYASADKIATLEQQLRKIDGINDISVNVEWLNRLNSVLNFLHSITKIIGLLLSIAIILVVSNTIGLQIQNRRQEIIITKLVGGTNAFVKRPFLYFGGILGLLGGAFCSAIYLICYLILEQPVQKLAISYGSNFSLVSLSGVHFLTFLLIGAMLGWLAAQLSVMRHLSAILPK